MLKEQTEKRILIAGPGIPMSQADIARALNVDKTRIKQIEKRALAKLKRSLLWTNFKEQDNLE